MTRAIWTLAALLALTGAAGAQVLSEEARAQAFEIDAFHPDRQRDAAGRRPPLPPRAFGGTFTLHTEALPRRLNPVIDNSVYGRRVLDLIHEPLLRRDPRTLEFGPALCRSWTVEDTLVRRGGRAAGIETGRVRAEGEQWVVSAADGVERRFPQQDFAALERGTVFTFTLRDDVRWHDGHPFDAQDVLFSFDLFANPKVDCDDKRFLYQKVVAAEVLDGGRLRFLLEGQYFQALPSLADLPILPRHLYDLTDPDNARADRAYHERRRAQVPDWKPDAAERADYVHANAHNQDWIGLGPYRLSRWEGDLLEVERWDGHFEPAAGGYFDRVRWRLIPDLSAALQALLSGEIDLFDILSTDDYFSEALRQESFTRRFYRGWHATAIWWFVAWNNQRPQFADPRVRRALALLFDFETFARTYYRSLAARMTGPFPPGAPGCDRAAAPLPFDPEEAVMLLAEAGWYDRDGDGLLDQDGTPFTIELLLQAGNSAGTTLAALYQEHLARVGIALRPATLEWNALNQRKFARDFDAIALGWSPPAESDPEQVWHSRWAPPEQRGGNFAGFADPECDRLIEQGQQELSAPARAEIWRQLHRRIYELQPYLFCFNPPRKFALARAVRGFTPTLLDPNFVLRELYYQAGTPGTRPQPARTPQQGR